MMLARSFVAGLLFTVGILAQSPLPREMQRLTCCDSNFSFAKVVDFAKRIVDSRRFWPPHVGVSLIIPSSRSKLFSVGSGGGVQTLARCVEIQTKLRIESSHAYLIVSLTGKAVHYWDQQKREYRKVVLEGRDILDVEIESGRYHLAWLGINSLNVPQIWVVGDWQESAEVALSIAGWFMQALKISNANVLIRSDPYYWPDSCAPYSIPIQWQEDLLKDSTGVARKTALCSINFNERRSNCAIHTAP